MTDTPFTLVAFLAQVERPALRMAQLSVSDTDKALDAVQDAMERLVRKYAHKPAEQWRPLFYRILQNRLRDVHRREALHRRWFRRKDRLSDEDGPAQDLESNCADTVTPSAEAVVAQASRVQAIENALKNLPERQRQAFLLRAWQELSVAETAQAMHCSQSAVKTHFSRAVKALRKRLKDVCP